MADPNYEWLRQFVTPDKIAKVKQLTHLANDLGQAWLSWRWQRINI